MRLLFASLSAAQWQKLASPQGLGAGDLQGEQRTLFLSLLPEPFRVQKVTATREGGYRSEGQNSFVTLSPTQKAGVRLRVNRSTSLSFPSATQTYSSYGIGDPGRNHPEGTEYYTLGYTSDYYARPDAYGVTLRHELPNRLKSGHLSFDAPALQGAVSLEGGTPPPPGSPAPAQGSPPQAGAPAGMRVGPDGVTRPEATAQRVPSLTVEELLKRVGKVAGLELYADRRVGRLPVWAKGGQARASDVLGALCLVVTGTFRKVGPAYVLTDDVEGIGTRRARLSEWAQGVGGQEYKNRQEQDKRIREMQPWQYLDFSPGDPFALDAGTLKKLEEKRAAMYRSPTADRDMPVTDLPPALLKHVQEELASSSSQERYKNARTDRVRLDVRTRLSYLVPGLGDLEDRYLSLYNIPALPTPAPGTMPDAPPAVLPPSLTARALYIAPANAEEAARAAKEARRRKLTHLWVEVPEGEGGKQLLSAAVKSGKGQGLMVFGVVRLLRRSGSTEPGGVPADSLDINILGETGASHTRRRLAALATTQLAPWTRDTLARSGGDWLRPDAPATPGLVKRRLLDLAATPGLTGLVLRDTAAPGYADPGDSSSVYSSSDRADFGYSLDARLQFLRQEGMDPIDMGSSGFPGGADLSLPFFSDSSLRPRMIEVEGRWISDPNAKSPGQQWNASRNKRNVRLMGEVYAAVRAAHPNLALLLSDRSDFSSQSWYGTWDKPDALPRRKLEFNEPSSATTAQTARSFSRRILLSATYRDPTVPDPNVKYTPREIYARTLGFLFDREKGNWDGIVFDLSAVPVDKALSLLEALPAAQKDLAAQESR